MRALTLLALATVVALGVAAGCAEDDFLDPLSSNLDCQEVCESYEECVDPYYDVAACRSRCLDETADDDTLKDRLSDCETCLDDSFCGDGIYPCSGICAGFLP
ncbi:MAG TPA: hypothetical protein VM686_22020 [Polyangiaceae bacterium]|nr:hypothetical protein [Polyangiaceae bacterium]